jgi:hypothetical protein
MKNQELRLFGKKLRQHLLSTPVMYQGFFGTLLVTVAQCDDGTWQYGALLHNGKQKVWFPYTGGYKSKEAARDALARKVRGLAKRLQEAIGDSRVKP